MSTHNNYTYTHTIVAYELRNYDANLYVNPMTNIVHYNCIFAGNIDMKVVSWNTLDSVVSSSLLLDRLYIVVLH